MSGQKTNGMAIAAFISSFFIAIVGVILGVVALNNIKQTGEKGTGFAWAGIIIGGFSILAAVALLSAW